MGETILNIETICPCARHWRTWTGEKQSGINSMEFRYVIHAHIQIIWGCFRRFSDSVRTTRHRYVGWIGSPSGSYITSISQLSSVNENSTVVVKRRNYTGHTPTWTKRQTWMPSEYWSPGSSVCECCMYGSCAIARSLYRRESTEWKDRQKKEKKKQHRSKTTGDE